MRLFRRPAPPPPAFITENTPVEVAIAAIYANQRSKELAFFVELERVITSHERGGLELSRIVRDLEATARALKKVAA